MTERSPIERINPPDLIPPQGMSHVVATRGGTTLHVAGQGYTADYQLVGPGDVGAQAGQAFRNVLTALAAAGATWRDVVKATFYVVGVTPETLEAFITAMHEVLGDDADPAPASTFVGVAALAFPARCWSRSRSRPSSDRGRGRGAVTASLGRQPAWGSPRHRRSVGGMTTLGIKLSPQLCSLDDLRSVWRIADESAFDHVWAFDHFNPIFAPLEGDIFEGMTILTAMAAATSRVRIGLMVAGTPTATRCAGQDGDDGRPPVGRPARVRPRRGMGGGRAHHARPALPYARAADPGLGEALTVSASCGRRTARTSTETTRSSGATHNPKPLQKPYPPIWIGGSGEQLTLRVVAEHADVWT